MQQTADFFQQASKVLTVSELTRSIRGALETKFGAVWVQGEVSNYKLHPSGHQYFTLKDARAQIACVIFRNTMAPLRQPLADGAHVQVYGNVSVFEARGQYQISVQIIQPRGQGVLQAKFEALKRKLDAEGLFDPARKRALPKFPKRIGIVTSPSGAAIRDMLNVLRRRAPWLSILINPVRVQGTGAAQEIAVAIRDLASPESSARALAATESFRRFASAFYRVAGANFGKFAPSFRTNQRNSACARTRRDIAPRLQHYQKRTRRINPNDRIRSSENEDSDARD